MKTQDDIIEKFSDYSIRVLSESFGESFTPYKKELCTKFNLIESAFLKQKELFFKKYGLTKLPSVYQNEFDDFINIIDDGNKMTIASYAARPINCKYKPKSIEHLKEALKFALIFQHDIVVRKIDLFSKYTGINVTYPIEIDQFDMPNPVKSVFPELMQNGFYLSEENNQIFDRNEKYLKSIPEVLGLLRNEVNTKLNNIDKDENDMFVFNMINLMDRLDNDILSTQYVFNKLSENCTKINAIFAEGRWKTAGKFSCDFFSLEILPDEIPIELLGTDTISDLHHDSI